MSLWQHGKYEAILPAYRDSKDNSTLSLPPAQESPKPVLLAVLSSDGVWWLQAVHTTPSSKLPTQHTYAPVVKLASFEWWEVDHARVITMTLQEARFFVSGIALNDVQLWPEHQSTEARLAELKGLYEFYTYTLRVDFSRFCSAPQAWRWKSIRKIARQWGPELAATHQWSLSVDDRPWQEARMAYDLRDMLGAVLDVRSAYATALIHLQYPVPGKPWQQLNAGARAVGAIHAVQWQPLTYVGRFYHPFRYSMAGVSEMPAYGLQDRVCVWVLDEDIEWLQRNGNIVSWLQSLKPETAIHPLQASSKTVMALLSGEKDSLRRSLLKKRQVSAHTWTWQPIYEFLLNNPENIVKRSIEHYTARPGPRVGGMSFWNEPDIGEVIRDIDHLQSGYYTPIMWLRMHLRSHLTRRVEKALDLGLEIAYVNVDGIHVRGAEDRIKQLSQWQDPFQPWWEWRVERTFLKGIWMLAGAYALQDESRQWKLTNWNRDITNHLWADWVSRRGALDVRSDIGFWRRSNDQRAWQGAAPIEVNAQRKLRNVIRLNLNKHI